MSARRRPGARASLVGCVLALALLGAGCTGMPTSGPVVETRADPAVDQARPMGIDPAPPTPGASAAEVANGFLDAMKAWPQNFEVARQYLAREDQASWNPDQATIVYADRGPILTDAGPQESVGLRLVDAARIDATGAWQGDLPASGETLRLRLVEEDGEYRIVDPPDQHVVPTDWFAERFRQANLYFFDPTSRILVPEPVYVPVGEQLASTLVQRLIAGPVVPDVTTTAFPSGLQVELSVPVSDAGVADIRLEGAPAPRSQDVVDRMLAQLAWTLGQEGITAVRLNIAGEEIRASGAPTSSDGAYDVDRAPQVDPAGANASTSLFGLSGGRLVSGTVEGALTPASGPFGTRPSGLRAVSVDPDGEVAAGVTLDGTRVLVAPVSAPAAEEQVEPEEVAVGTDLLPPAWDFDGRIWLVDRTGSGVEVSYVSRGRQRVVQVPGVSGQQVSAFTVSRDGTRFVAVVRGANGDEVRVGRVVLRDARAVARVLPATSIDAETGQGRIVDLAWTSTTTLAALTPVALRERYEVRSLGVDGAPTVSDTTSVNGAVLGLVGTPVPEQSVYAATAASLFDLTTLTSRVFEGPIISLGYAG